MKISEIIPDMQFGKLKIIRKMNDTYKLSIDGLTIQEIQQLDDTYVFDEEKNQEFIQIPYFECLCDCGKTCNFRGDLLIANLITSCGCSMLPDNIEGFKDILIQHQVHFKENYTVSNSKIRPFHFGILDNDNQLLGLIDMRPDKYLSRIGNEEENRVEQRKTIYNEKQEYCLNNGIKYLIIPTLPVFYENWNNIQLSWKEICNQTWQRIKTQINEAFNINEEIHWYVEVTS